MKITAKDLLTNRFSKEDIYWFKKYFPRPIDIWEVIAYLRLTKQPTTFMMCLFEKYNLTGLVEHWDYRGNLLYQTNYKKGEIK